MNIARYAARREKLRELMSREGLDALLISHPANRFYLSGFELHDCQCNESSGHLLILRNGKDWLCTDSRYEESAAERWDRERVFIYKGPAAEEIRDLIRSNVSARIGIESAILSHDFVTRLEPGLSLEAADGLVEELQRDQGRRGNTPHGRKRAVNHQLMGVAALHLTAGNTEANIAWSIEKFFREHGATESSFSPIVARDAHAPPHYNPFEEAGGRRKSSELPSSGGRGRHASATIAPIRPAPSGWGTSRKNASWICSTQSAKPSARPLPPFVPA